MAYESKTLRRFKCRYDDGNADNLITHQLVLDGAKVTPTSATIATYSPDGTAILAAAAMTVTGSLMTYAISTTTEADYPVGTGYRAHIVVTYNAITYEHEIIFDVVKFLLRLNVGADQLIARDDSIKAMEWNGDEDLSEIIEACRDELQLKLESKATEDGQLLENMVLDASRVAIPFRLYVLAQIFFGKKMHEDGKRYKEMFDEMFRAVLQGIEYDTNQDLSEDGDTGQVQVVRFVT